MLRVNLDKSGLLRLQSQISGVGKQAAFATMRALNAAAYKGSTDVAKQIGVVFDRPTPWVSRSVRYVKATRDKLEASIDFDFWGNKQGVTVSDVLRAEIFGGPRKLKRFERALQRAGILPPGLAIVPGPAAKMDRHGNMSAGQIVQILSWFQSFGEQGYRANMRDGGKRLARGNKKTGARGFAYFALYQKRGKLIPGIYQRFDFGAMGSAVKPVMYFVALPKYRQRLDFYGVAARSARAEFALQFPRLFQEALRSAR